MWLTGELIKIKAWFVSPIFLIPDPLNLLRTHIMLLVLCAILFNFIYFTLVEMSVLFLLLWLHHTYLSVITGSLSQFITDTVLPGVVKVVKKLLG